MLSISRSGFLWKKFPSFLESFFMSYLRAKHKEQKKAWGKIYNSNFSLRPKSTAKFLEQFVHVWMHVKRGQSRWNPNLNVNN